MSRACDLSFQQRGLFQQGYQRYTPQQLRQLEWGLRFTPAACSLIALYGLASAEPLVLFAVAVLGIYAFAFPAGHPMDMLYNRVVRHWFGAIALPPNPLQRRLACLSAGLMNIAAGVLFLLAQPLAAYLVGGALLVLQAIVIATHFCTLSWMYEGLMRMLGRWRVPVALDTARDLLAAGATLVDVRSPNEFAAGHLEGALNLPLEALQEDPALAPRGTLLLYCRSGMRSQIAHALLTARDAGEPVHDLGGMTRAGLALRDADPALETALAQSA